MDWVKGDSLIVTPFLHLSLKIWLEQKLAVKSTVPLVFVTVLLSSVSRLTAPSSTKVNGQKGQAEFSGLPSIHISMAQRGEGCPVFLKAVSPVFARLA